MKPHVCPVCNGRGLVPGGFYMLGGETLTATAGTEPETCNTCKGFGVLWGNETPPPLTASISWGGGFKP